MAFGEKHDWILVPPKHIQSARVFSIALFFLIWLCRFLSITVFGTSLWALDRWERGFLKGAVCAGQPFMFVISFIPLHQCLCSIFLPGCREHCCMFYLESCAIGQIPKIVSFAGAEIRLFLNGIFLRPHGEHRTIFQSFKFLNSRYWLIVVTQTLSVSCSRVSWDIGRLCIAPGFSS